jgi:hypothetical protein
VLTASAAVDVLSVLRLGTLAAAVNGSALPDWRGGKDMSLSMYLKKVGRVEVIVGMM